jgi:penicillin-binding protein 2
VIDRGVERRNPVPAQLARRIGVLGAIGVVAFGIVFLRLWYLQVLTGTTNAQLAAANVTRVVPIAAPRGLIVARGGQVLAENRTAAAVSVSCSALPGSRTGRAALYARLGRVLSVSAAVIAREVDCAVVPAYQPIVVDTDVSTAALVYLAEHRPAFPAVSEQPTPLRVYPYGSLAAQVLGNVRLFNTSDLGGAVFAGVSHADVVGQSGLEYEYEQALRGRDGVEHVQVNATGLPTGRPPVVTAPTQGDELLTSLDVGLEQEGMKALSTAITLAHRNGYPAPAASFAAIDPRNGEVLAIGSTPSFDPNVL